jgi:hypothetical protein
MVALLIEHRPAQKSSRLSHSSLAEVDGGSFLQLYLLAVNDAPVTSPAASLGSLPETQVGRQAALLREKRD